MKKVNFFIVFVLFLNSCNKSSEISDRSSSSEIQATSIENLNIQTNSFSEIDSTGILLFPLEMGQSKRDDGSYSYKKMPDDGFWNIIFLNSITNEYHLLTENKMLILNYDYKYNNEEGINPAKKSNYIFYLIRSLDYNKDRLLNDQDPIYLFVSDKFGKNFRQISPSNQSLKNWKIIQRSNKVMMTAANDSNGDKLFDDNDEVLTYEIILDEGKKAQEVFSSEIKNKIKRLYDRDWKRIQ